MRNASMIDISVVIPIRDEASNLHALTDSIVQVLESASISFEIIYVTDLNKDDTQGVLINLCMNDMRVKAIKLANSFGQHVAVIAGLRACVGRNAIIMDGDLQDSPSDIPKLYDKLREGFDVVYGIKERKNDSFARNLSSSIFNSLMKRFSEVKTEPNTSMFRIISRRAILAVLKFTELEPSLTYIFSYINLPSTTIPVESSARIAGKTKYSFARLFNFAVSSMLSFSRRPLRMITRLGFIIALLSFAYLSVILIRSLKFGTSVTGWLSLAIIISALGGIQLICIGVLGEYIGRIYMQTKGRPLFIVERRYGRFEKNCNAIKEKDLEESDEGR
jgi:glycosyltransferase involved in cell wall biosynthesis